MCSTFVSGSPATGKLSWRLSYWQVITRATSTMSVTVWPRSSTTSAASNWRGVPTAKQTKLAHGMRGTKGRLTMATQAEIDEACRKLQAELESPQFTAALLLCDRLIREACQPK